MTVLNFGNNTVRLAQSPDTSAEAAPLARLFIAAPTERGPVDTALQVSSAEQFLAAFGAGGTDSAEGAAYRTVRDYFSAVGRYGDVVVIRLYEGGELAITAGTARETASGTPKVTVRAGTAGAHGNNLERRVTQVTAATPSGSGAAARTDEVITTTVEVRERVGTTIKGRRTATLVEKRGKLDSDTDWTYTDAVTAEEIGQINAAWGTFAQLDFDEAGTALLSNVEAAGAAQPLWVPFVGGADSADITAATLVGGIDEETQERSGLYVLRNTELGGGVILTPGLTSFDLNKARLAFAQDTMRLTLLEPDGDKTPGGAKLDKARYENVDGASFGAYIYPLAREARATGAVSVTALGHVAGLIVAGINREKGKVAPPAGLTTIADVQRAPNGRDLLVHERNATDLQAAGINTLVVRSGKVELQGLSLLNGDTLQPATDKVYERLVLNTIAYDVGPALARYNNAYVDAKGVFYGVIEGAIRERLRKYHESGVLYGAGMDDAFRVVIDLVVNNPVAIAKTGRVNVKLKLKISPVAEGIDLELYHVALDVAL